MKHVVVSLLLLLLFFLATPSSVVAKLVINEFSSSTADDWIELYNDGSEPVLLTDFRLRDSTDTNKLDLEGTLFPYTVKAVDWYNRLNKSGDTIKIVAKTDESKIEDQITYGNSTIAAPGENQSVGRKTNGGGEWSLFASATKGSSNEAGAAIQPSPTITPTPTKSPTPTKVPTPSKTPTPIKSGPTTTTQTKSMAAATTRPNTVVLEASDGPPNPTSVFATNESEKEKDEGQIIVGGANESNPWQRIVSLLPILGGLVSLAFCGILVYLQHRKKQSE